ncbi:MAG: heavy-metal-associated domain-containing protein [Erysipelotrichaceae bacterium]|nr:heavy-metal-associated domain-containing protein [Erysipelotrichaceae bacterium]
MYKVTMKIDGMICSMCEAHINDIIRKNAADAKKVTSSHSKGESSFLCDSIPDVESLKEAIRQTGYEVKDIRWEEYEKKKWNLFG